MIPYEKFSNLFSKFKSLIIKPSEAYDVRSYLFSTCGAENLGYRKVSNDSKGNF